MLMMNRCIEAARLRRHEPRVGKAQGERQEIGVDPIKFLNVYTDTAGGQLGYAGRGAYGSHSGTMINSMFE